MEEISKTGEDHQPGEGERARVALFGRCLLPNKLEIPCQARELSTGDVEIASAHIPAVGEHLIVYLDHVGRLEGDAESTSDFGFTMSIMGSDRKRQKLASRIEWLKENHHFSTHAERRHDRIQPSNRNSMIKLPDGRTYPVEIIDISLSGAAFSAPVRPAIGTILSLAGMQGTVVRLFDEGVAIEFAKYHSPHALAQ